MSDQQTPKSPAGSAAAPETDPSPDTPEGLMAEASSRISALEAECAELRDRWVRAEAEMQNLRARTRREAEDARLYAVQGFARDVVETAENLRRGLAALPAPAADEPEVIGKLREGFSDVERSFIALLERNGITREDPTGTAFDANRHQAMAEQPSAEHPPGTVLQAWTAAWLLHGRLLRPAMVVVAKAPDVATASSGD